jgi:cardiolipin synthase (CMP-forming)
VVDERAATSETPQVPPEAPDHSRDIYTVANIVTVLRLMLVPFFFAVLIRGTHNFAAFVLFAVAASTDWLDGQIARRTGTETALGKAIDPLVDRLLIASGVFGLWLVDRLPGWIVFVLVARDVYLGYGAWRLEQLYHRRLAVTYVGKLTTAVLLAGFADLVLGWPLVRGAGVLQSSLAPGLGSQPAALGIWLVYVGILLSIAGAIQYSFVYLRAVRDAREQAAATVR